MSHNHHHHSASKNLGLAFFLNLAFTILELVGGYWVNSVAIISDAIHDLGDSISLGFSWLMERKAKSAPTKRFSFGYRRFSLLGALINSIILILGSVFVIKEAIDRLISPEIPDAKGMLIFAVFGVAVNGYAAWKLSGGKTLNEKVITWHLLEDVLGWVAVLIASIAIYFWEIPLLDPILSLAITAFILWNVIKRLKETILIFLQSQPAEIDRKKVEKELLEIAGICSVHHTHIWSLDGERHVFSTHLKLKKETVLEEIATIKREVKKRLEKFHFEHITLETELEGDPCEFE